MMWTAEAKTIGESVISVSLDTAFVKIEHKVREFFESVGVNHAQNTVLYPRSARAEVEIVMPQNRTLAEFDSVKIELSPSDPREEGVM